MLNYICTLEHPTQQPEVIRGMGKDPDACAKNAFRAVERSLSRFKWTSLVLVIETPETPHQMKVFVSETTGK